MFVEIGFVKPEIYKRFDSRNGCDFILGDAKMRPDLLQDNSIPLPTPPTQPFVGLGLKYLTWINHM